MEGKTINLQLILNGCRQGNRYSQEKLYQYYYPYAISIALRYSKDRNEAREILNESFLKVFTKLDRYDKDYSFQAWLRRIVINTAIDFYRKKKRRPSFLSLDTISIGVENPLEDFEIDPNINTLPIIQKLPPSYRIVFNLYVMEGYKHHEIAEKLGVSVSTSKTNLARAKQKLKKMIISRANYKMQGNG